MRTVVALLACLAALALPAGALAQGAGDDQYSDPFGSSQPTATATPAPAPAPAAPAPSTSSSSAPSTASPSAAPGAAATPSASSAPAPAPAPAVASRPQLPYTGAPAWLTGAAGVLLLAGGLALRVRLREPA